MKILFSPSETKIKGGVKKLNLNELCIFDNLCEKQKEVLDRYQSYIDNSSDEKLHKLFGLKDISEFKNINLFNDLSHKAINRYTGVAYDYLQYQNLNKNQQNFIDDNMIIFSNLFGPIYAKSFIPNYKLKQGEKIGNFSIEKHYNKYFSNSLDKLLENEFVVDLRAGFYLKFYKPKVEHITMKFIKNGKVVSHWAKAYRGAVAKTLSNYQPQNEKEFQKIEFKNLQILEIIKRKYAKEYIFNIVES